MLATVSRKAKQTCNTKDQRRDSKRRCRRSLCVIWQILQCYNFRIEGSSGIHLCTQMESFLRHYDHYAEKNFWFGKFCNATIFSSKAALVFIYVPRWSDFPETMMQRRTSNVVNSAVLQFSDWRPGLRIICACPNSLIFQRWQQCWDELLMCRVLQCYSFLIEGGSGDPFAFSNGVIF